MGTVGEPIVKEHTVTVPTYGYYGKRSADADADADPYLLYGGYGLGYGHGYYGHGYGYGLYGHGLYGHYYGKRDADAAVVSPLVYGGYPYAYAHAVVPATPEVTYKTYTPTVETNVVATNLPVPVAVGGYKSVAGDNGDLKGAVHEVPALFGAPALNTQVNEASQGSLTVGTSAVVTHTVGEPIVKEHTVTVPTYGYYGKRSADADADPLLWWILWRLWPWILWSWLWPLWTWLWLWPRIWLLWLILTIRIKHPQPKIRLNKLFTSTKDNKSSPISFELKKKKKKFPQPLLKKKKKKKKKK